jgi:hypothetical protein
VDDMTLIRRWIQKFRRRRPEDGSSIYPMF